MRKDDHLIYEAFANRVSVSDEQAAKIIADKIRGTPNLNIQNIKMYVTKYLGMVGKAPTDVDHITAHVNDILSAQGMSESEESTREENEERRLDPKCWKGYHKQGTKLKGGKRVNNCVKNR
jgi:hypothetical protein